MTTTMAGSSSTTRKRPAAAFQEENEQRKRERESRILARFENLSKDDTEETLRVISRKWNLLSSTSNTSFQDIVDTAFQNFGFNLTESIGQAQQNHATDGTHGLQLLDERIHEAEMEAIALYHKLREHHLLDDEVVLKQAVSCIEQVYYSKRVVLSTYQSLRGVANANASLEGETPANEQREASDQQLDQSLGSWSLRFRWIDDDIGPYQRLLLHMLDRAVDKSYRRHGDMCFEPVIIDEHNTHAWKAATTIKEWIYQETQKETNFEQWHWMTANATNVKSVETYLTNCVDFSFPVLRKDRSTFSFLNGVYRAKENTFYPYPTTLGAGIASCKFFDTEFPVDMVSVEDPMLIPTPHLESIMNYQEWDTDVQKWMFIMLGRLLYNLNEMDAWQVIPFCSGVAGSGKSSMTLKVAKAFYADEDVGTLSNNIETKFGLSQFYNKLLFVAPEIKADLRIEQAEFQSIVSGEDLTINVKNRTAFSTQWCVPGFLAGNEVPAWADNSGSIQRRIVLFDFPKQVTNGDMRLADKLQDELPTILLKANRLYLDMVQKHGSENIWTILPAYFQRTRAELAATTNVLEAFLVSDSVLLQQDAVVSMDDFKMAVRTFATSNNFTIKRFTKDFFRACFDKHGIERRKETREYRGRMVSREFLYGVTLNEITQQHALG